MKVFQVENALPSKRRLLSSTQDQADRCSSLSNGTQENDTVSVNKPNICAKLLTTTKDGRKEALVLTLDRPMIIGRNSSQCSYVIDDRVVSNVHCKFYAVLSSTGGVMVSCQDTSTNGIMIGRHRVRRASAIIMDGDTVEIPQSQIFTCVHILKESKMKAHIFESTPPQNAGVKNLQVGRYIIMEHCLGTGTFATVHLAVDTQRFKQVACKTVVTRSKDKSDIQKFMKEVHILQGLQHPNINRVWDVYVDEKNSWLHIFLELCTGGDLFTYITSHTESGGRLCEGEAKYIMFQILKGLKYLHDRLISHRGSLILFFNIKQCLIYFISDLKPENILLYTPGAYPRIQIADFGLARPKAYQETMNVCGTVAYLPPEGIMALDRKDLGYVGMPADCWSAGIILYSMLTGTHPFDKQGNAPDCGHNSIAPSQMSRRSRFSQSTTLGEQDIKKKIIRGEVEFAEYIWYPIPKAKILVAKLLVYNYRFRETVYGALRSDWIMSDIATLQEAYKSRVDLD